MIADRLPKKLCRELSLLLMESKTLEAIYKLRSELRSEFDLSAQESREQIEYFCEKHKIPFYPTQIFHIAKSKQSSFQMGWLLFIVAILLVILAVAVLY